MNKPPDPNHVPGINKGEEASISKKEPGRSNDTKNYRSARDSTGCDAKRRGTNRSSHAEYSAGLTPFGNIAMTTTEGRPIAALGKLKRARGTEEQCELCSIGLSHQHRHLLEVANGRLLCACEPCAMRFENVIGRFRLIPREPRALDLQMTDEFWEGLSIPINLAFFSYRTTARRIMAMYPSPAGVTESLLPLTNWEALTLDNPSLATMEKDVEALLVNRIESRREYFIVPIDFCFHLVGLVRMHWRGLSGDAVVWQKLEEFFANLRTQCGAAPQLPSKAEHA